MTTNISKYEQEILLENSNLNDDPNPIVIRKKVEKKVTLVQNVSLKFLRPTLAEQPGDITIIQEPDTRAPPDPPLVIRQIPLVESAKAEPIIIRERPPLTPTPIGPKKIVIIGKKLPPPPRKIIFEKLAPQPPKPQDIIIERWLDYKKRTRNVIFRPASPIQPERNLIIQWKTPDVILSKKYTFLGVQNADPALYKAKYGNNFLASSLFPKETTQFAENIGEILAADKKPVL